MNVKLEIRHLRLLAAVAEHGSVTAAAKSLHLTQSALSHQIRDAEERLETCLFRRCGKKMVLTPAGDYLLSTARRLLQELQSAEVHVQQLASDLGSAIRLCTECNTSYHWLPFLWGRFQQRFPNVKVQIDVDSTSDPLGALLEGKLDLALVTCSGNRNSNISFLPIGEDEVMVVLPVQHRLAANQYVSPADFEGETVLVFPPREGSRLLNEYLLPAGVRPREVLEIPLTEVMIEMAASNMGLAWLSKFAVAPYITAGRVAARRFTRNGIRRIWYAAMLRDHPGVPYLQEFVEMLGEPLRGGWGFPGWQHDRDAQA